MSRVNPLTLAELDRRIRELEGKYGIATVIFLKDPNSRAAISEDDVLMWETYIDFRRELRDLDERMQRRYLGRIAHHGDKSNRPADLVELAA